MNFEKDKIGQFDAICFLSTTQNPFSPFKEEWKKMSDDEKRLRKATPFLPHVFRQTRVSATFPPKANS